MLFISMDRHATHLDVWQGVERDLFLTCREYKRPDPLIIFGTRSFHAARTELGHMGSHSAGRCVESDCNLLKCRSDLAALHGHRHARRTETCEVSGTRLT